MIRDFVLSARLLGRDWRAGELWLIGIAIVLAVASVTTVGFFADRVHKALNRQANQLLGADLVVVGDRALPAELEREAFRRALAVTRMMRFPSMAVHRDRNVLADIKVVSAGYPLRGELRVADRLYGEDRRADGVPSPGTAWVDDRVVSQLGVVPGDQLELGKMRFRVGAIVTQEPDSAIGFINAGPRILINEADVAATGLVQSGSRVRYRLQIAGIADKVDDYREWIQGRLQPGQRVEGIRDARPEIRSALDRAERFLGLAALVSVVLAAVSIALAARRFLQRHIDGCAVMRCLGASTRRIIGLYVVHMLLLGLVASLIGSALGGVAQQLLAQWLAGLVKVDLPAPGLLPAIHGFVAGQALLLGFVLPPLIALGNVPTLRVLRRDLPFPGGAGIAGYALGAAVIAGMILMRADSWKLGGIVLGGFAAVMLIAGAAVWLLIRLLAGWRAGGINWRFGVANLRRRPLGAVVQIVGLSLGIMALLTLTVIRGDLLHAWRASLPPDAPNRFIVNVQADQIAPLRAFFEQHGVAPPRLFPMVRGRLVAINGRAVSSADYVDDRARRLIDREFNLSWARQPQADNRIVAGRWWDGAPSRQDQFSMEDGIAATLQVRLGDALTFDVAGARVVAPVTSLRKVDWDSFNVNFFMVSPPGFLDGHPATYVTSFHLPPGNAALLNALVQTFPNFLLIDVAQVLAQVQKMIDQVARAVQFVFLFTLLAGLLVLYAAIAGTQDERRYQAALLRTLGANRGQLVRANLAEFAAIGTMAGLLAAGGASALGWTIAAKVLNVSFAPGAAVWIGGVACSAAGVMLAGYFGTRGVLDAAPLRTLRDT